MIGWMDNLRDEQVCTEKKKQEICAQSDFTGSILYSLNNSKFLTKMRLVRVLSSLQ